MHARLKTLPICHKQHDDGICVANIYRPMQTDLTGEKIGTNKYKEITKINK